MTALARCARVVRAALCWLCACALAACNAPSPAGASGSIRLTGAGASFPYPLYSRWIASYRLSNPGTEINYQSLGSGGGIRQLLEGTIDFGASDIPLSPDEARRARSAIVHVPSALSAVAVAYNLPGIAELRLDQAVLSQLFLGRITRWSDARIAAANPHLALPDEPVRVVFRSDGSGTTALFTEYLSKVSQEFLRDVGQGASVTWPSGIGAAGNEGVTAQVKSTTGTLAYVEVSTALHNGLAVAAVKNRAGEFIKPTPSSIARAADGVTMPPELHVSLTDGPHADAYPIAAYTYFLVYEDHADSVKGTALARFLWWTIHDGQKLCSELHYAALPPLVVSAVEARLKSLRSGARQLLSES